MKGTACEGCKNKKCPNFIVTPWQSGNGDIEMVEDCAPKRTMLMIQSIHNSFVGLQKSHEELRNKVDELIQKYEEDDGNEEEDFEVLIRDLNEHLDTIKRLYSEEPKQLPHNEEEHVE